jgi:hypothetical protein
MGVRILQGDKSHDGAVLYCSVSMWAFGPVFEDEDEAQQFLNWLDVDPRKLSEPELHVKYLEFLEREKSTDDEET